MIKKIYFSVIIIIMLKMYSSAVMANGLSSHMSMPEVVQYIYNQKNSDRDIVEVTTQILELEQSDQVRKYILSLRAKGFHDKWSSQGNKEDFQLSVNDYKLLVEQYSDYASMSHLVALFSKNNMPEEAVRYLTILEKEAPQSVYYQTAKSHVEILIDRRRRHHEQLYASGLGGLLEEVDELKGRIFDESDVSLHDRIGDLYWELSQKVNIKYLHDAILSWQEYENNFSGDSKLYSKIARAALQLKKYDLAEYYLTRVYQVDDSLPAEIISLELRITKELIDRINSGAMSGIGVSESVIESQKDELAIHAQGLQYLYEKFPSSR